MNRRALLGHGLAAMGALLLLDAPVPERPAGQTICTVTINSSDERDELRAVFQDARFVELTDFASADSVEKTDWLPRACEAGVQCDVLLISGHFANYFFGDTRFELPMRALEEASCRSSCDGVIKAPRLVFLFGCNTLATKRPDQRSPRAYRDVLVADGLDPDLAERVVALRYGPLGDETSARVRKIFRQGALIFGFSSVAPVGEVAGPHFRRFLVRARRPLLETVPGGTSSARARAALRRQWLASFEGLNPAFVQGGPPLSRDECRFRDPRSPRTEKLEMAGRLLDEAPLDNALPVFDFLQSESGWNAEERAVLARIEHNRSAAGRVTAALPRLVGTPSLYLSLLEFVRLVGWMDEPEFERLRDERVAAMLLDGVTAEEQELLCSRSPAFTPSAAVLARNRASVHFLRTLPCVAAQTPEVREFLVTHLTYPSAEVQLAALEALTQLELLTPDDVERLRAVTARAPAEVRAAVLWALASSDGERADVQRLIAEAAVDPEPEVAFASGQILRELEASDPEALRLLARALGHESGFVRRTVALAFEALQPADPTVIDALRPYLETADPVVAGALRDVVEGGRTQRRPGRDGPPVE